MLNLFTASLVVTVVSEIALFVWLLAAYEFGKSRGSIVKEALQDMKRKHPILHWVYTRKWWLPLAFIGGIVGIIGASVATS